MQQKEQLDNVESSSSKKQINSLKHVSAVDIKTALSWKDVNVFAKNTACCGCLNNGNETQVIINVSGEIQSGKILAIMGSSGAGKTTLLNVLSGRNMPGFRVEGTVAINGRVTDFDTIKSLSAYVQQEDIFLCNLTVREHLYYQSLLRMEDNKTAEERSNRVNELMTELDLIRCGDNLIGGTRRKGISGGEKKRVALASEIVGNPSILFLDEPTSGLDSHIAEKTVTLMEKLAGGGQTVICTIHQPSSQIFNKFDVLLLICGGKVAFMGSTGNAQVFFESLGYRVPKYFNPADVYIKTLAVDSEQIENSNKRNDFICEAYKQSQFAMTVHMDVSQPHLFSGKFKASFWTQFHVILRRTWKNNIRENVFLFVLIEELIGAFIFGFLFSRQTLNQTGVKNYNGAIFYLIVTLLFQLCFVEIRMFFEEIELVYRELDSNLYSVTAYFWAYTMAAMPYQLLAAGEFSLVFYLLVGFGGPFVKLLNFMLISILMSQAVVSFVYLVCAIFLNLILAMKVVSTLFGLLFLLSGTLIDYATIPSALEFSKYISFTYLANEAYVLNQWYKVDNISCEVLRIPSKTRNSTGETEGICLNNGMKVIDSFNFNADNLELDIGLLFSIFVVYRILANIVLCFRLQRV